MYLGVDVGGTKVRSSLVTESGEALGRQRCATPRQGGSEEVLAALDHLATVR